MGNIESSHKFKSLDDQLDSEVHSCWTNAANNVYHIHVYFTQFCKSYRMTTCLKYQLCIQRGNIQTNVYQNPQTNLCNFSKVALINRI